MNLWLFSVVPAFPDSVIQLEQTLQSALVFEAKNRSNVGVAIKASLGGTLRVLCTCPKIVAGRGDSVLSSPALSSCSS